jgi:regulatory protein
VARANAAPGEGMELALSALRRKERSTAELRVWLRARGVTEEEVEATLGRLGEIGELDDSRFAQRFAEDKRDLQGWGPERIGGVLARRGIAPELIERAVAGEGTQDQVARAASLLARRGDRADDDRSRARALAYLTRRGYSYDVAYEAVRAHGAAA